MGKFTTLETAQLTKHWSVEERAAVAHFLKPRTLKEGEALYLAKSTDRCLYFLESGLLKVQYEYLAGELKAGDSFGEISLVLPNIRHLTAITAIKECQLWSLPLEDWAQLKKAAPIVSLKLMESIVQKVGALIQTLPPPPRTTAPAPSPSKGA